MSHGFPPGNRQSASVDVFVVGIVSGMNLLILFFGGDQNRIFCPKYYFTTIY